MKMDIHGNEFRRGRELFKFVFLVVVLAGTVSCQEDQRQNEIRFGSDTAENGSLVFSTYIGGSKSDSIRDLVTDCEGNIYITGGTHSSNFPTKPGTYDGNYNGSADVFVMKLDSKGSPIWSTFLSKEF